MNPTSEAQYEATKAGTVAPLEQVRPNVWTLPLAMPHVQLPAMLSYLVVDDAGDVHVIDPGWDSDENWQRVLAALAQIGRGPSNVVTATMTHLHRDHLGMALRYRAETPARLQIASAEQAAIHRQAAISAEQSASEYRVLAAEWGVPDDRRAELETDFGAENDTAALEADALLNDGDDLGAAGTGIRVVSTPGHTTGSICLAAPDLGLLFTGDHVLPTIYSGLGLGGPSPRDPVTEYLESLDRIAKFDAFEVLPGHGFRFTGLAERRGELAEHHLRRSREAAAVLADDPQATVWSVASRLHWSAGWAALRGPFLRSALAQTSWHMQRVAAAAV